VGVEAMGIQLKKGIFVFLLCLSLSFCGISEAISGSVSFDRDVGIDQFFGFLGGTSGLPPTGSRGTLPPTGAAQIARAAQFIGRSPNLDPTLDTKAVAPLPPIPVDFGPAHLALLANLKAQVDAFVANLEGQHQTVLDDQSQDQTDLNTLTTNYSNHQKSLDVLDDTVQSDIFGLIEAIYDKANFTSAQNNLFDDTLALADNPNDSTNNTLSNRVDDLKDIKSKHHDRLWSNTDRYYDAQVVTLETQHDAFVSALDTADQNTLSGHTALHDQLATQRDDLVTSLRDLREKIHGVQHGKVYTADELSLLQDIFDLGPNDTLNSQTLSTIVNKSNRLRRTGSSNVGEKSERLYVNVNTYQEQEDDTLDIFRDNQLDLLSANALDGLISSQATELATFDSSLCNHLDVFNDSIDTQNQSFVNDANQNAAAINVTQGGNPEHGSTDFCHHEE
jgi:hypothetical protein